MNIGLEEVRFDYDSDKWFVTIGFSRPWDEHHPFMGHFSADGRRSRSYKELCINDTDGKVESLQDRVLGSPEAV